MPGMNEAQSDAAPGTCPYCGQLLPEPLRLRSYQGMNDVLQSIKPTVKGLDSIDIVILEAIKIRPGQAAYQILGSLPAIRTKSIYRARLERLAVKGFLRLERNIFKGRVLCYLTEAGEQALAEGEPCTQ